jgi:6,7-dimethyl-8-ribityllumazine synthase
VSAAGKRAPTGGASAAGLDVAVVASRFNGEFVDRLLASALATLEGLGLARSRVAVYRVPGAFELPLMAGEVARARRPDCILALGAVIRGQTPHFDFVAGEAARGLMEVSLATGVPVSFGVITADSVEQAQARTRPPLDRGAEAARAAVEMARAVAEVRAGGAMRGPGDAAAGG